MERTTHIGAGLAAAILALCVLLCHPAAAYSDGGVEFVGITSQGSPDVSAVDPNAFVAVHFSKNVSFANHGRDPAFVEANREKIHLVDASGASVAADVAPGGDDESKRLFYVRFEETLSPLSTYRVVMDEGIAAANGSDATDREYVAEFRTNALCSNGLMLYENIFIAVIVALAAAGIAATAFRKRRERP